MQEQKALISALIAGGWIAFVIILIVVLLGCAVSLFGGGSESTSYTPVSAEVEAYTPLIQKYAKQYGIPEYVELIKAVMMQESGGRGLDPMQAAEGSFNTRYPHEPNGIKDPEYSIECGVQELKAALISAEVENPLTWSVSSSPCRAITSAMVYLMGENQLRRLFLRQCGRVFHHAGTAVRVGKIRRHTVPRPCVTLLSVWTGVHKRQQPSHCRGRFDTARK